VAGIAACALLLLLASCRSVPPVRPANVTPVTLPPGSTTPSPVTPADWTTYHDNAARTGYVPGIADPQHLTHLWDVPLDGAVYAEPLVVGGRVLVATEQDSIYSLDARTGQVRWHTSVGSPVQLSSLPCGNIDPLGITGTPVFDPQTSLVFAVAEISGPAHILVGLDVHTGQVRVRRQVDLPGMDPRTHQQRAALALEGGRVYVAYGGLFGDCGSYHGLVVASRTDGTGPLLSYQVPTQREAGIWATPGPAIDAQGNLYVAVGNGAAMGGAWDHSDSILRLSPTLQLEDGFAPQSWASENASDADLGSMGPSLLPNGLVYADGKSGNGYLLQADHLGGVGGQLQAISVCAAFGGAAVDGESIIVPCTNGLQQVTVAASSQLVVGWHAPSQVTASPIIGGNTVYCLDPSGTLYALDAGTGAVRTALAVGATSHFATPALSQGTVFVGTLTGIVAVSLS
jgi:outer membrane protein assembly factor BamB